MVKVEQNAPVTAQAIPGGENADVTQSDEELSNVASHIVGEEESTEVTVLEIQVHICNVV